jgi:hypothetical protein
MSTTKYVVPVETVDSWDSAIAKARQKISRLKQGIAAFREMRDGGEPWPGAVTPLHGNQDANGEA